MCMTALLHSLRFRFSETRFMIAAVRKRYLSLFEGLLILLIGTRFVEAKDKGCNNLVGVLYDRTPHLLLSAVLSLRLVPS